VLRGDIVPSPDKLLALLNADNPAPYKFTFNNVSFSLPATDNGPNWNTRVRVSGVPGSAYTGQVNVFYRRVPLSEPFDVMPGLMSDVPFTPNDVLNELNGPRVAADMTMSDLMPFTIPEMVLGDAETIHVHAHPNSLAWIDKGTTVLMLGLSDPFDKLHKLVNVTLPSPNYI
jgi:hypothetical protein